jgi:hypothetical protein
MPGPDSSAAPPTTEHYHNIILMYQMIPDNTRVYHLNVGNENFHRICKLHNKYANLHGNTDEEENELLWLNEFVADKYDVFDSDAEDENHNKPYLMLNPCTVVVSGWMM